MVREVEENFVPYRVSCASGVEFVSVSADRGWFFFECSVVGQNIAEKKDPEAANVAVTLLVFPWPPGGGSRSCGIPRQSQR